MSAKRSAMTTKPPAGKHRIYLVDDHPLLREGLAQRIGHEPDLEVCGQADNATAALPGIQAARPELAIVDISLPGRDGIELTKDLRATCPQVKVLVLTLHAESLYAERALRAGALGFVMKNEPPERLVAAIHRVLAGEIAVGPSTATRLLSRIADGGRDNPRAPVELLTDRELEIFRRLGQGQARRQIAAELHLSVKTIEAHRANMRQKFGVSSAAELLQHAIQFVQREGA